MILWEKNLFYDSVKLVLYLQIFKLILTGNLIIKDIDFMPPKITAKKVSSKTIRPSSSNRLNSLKANSDAQFLGQGSVAVFGILLFFAFVIAQIIFIN